MKRMYIKPEICIEECIAEMFATSGGDNGPVSGGGTINPDPMEPAANSHRGGWGNLWGGNE